MTQSIEPPTGTANQKGKRRRSFFRFTLVVVVLLIAALVAISAFLPLNPVSSIFKTMGYAVSGRLHLPNQRIGEVVTDEEGEQFTIFREVLVDPTKDQPEHPGAILVLHFKVTNISPELNKFYSLLPLPLYIGDPGFRSKLFTINGEDCQSIYEWDTVQDARNYVNSMALKTILKRTVPGSVSYKIVSPQK
jgi:hypothetical protein